MKFIASPASIVASILILLSLASAPVTAAQRMADTATVQGAEASAGGYHALVIGNNDYASLPKLKTAESDARQVAALLKEYYGFETALLINATRAQIVSALAGYRRRLGPEARLLVYYAGHGVNDRATEKAYWLPVDATRDDPANWIIADEITTALKAVPARHVLVISDSCYSGTLTRGLGESLPPPNERERFIERMVAGKSRMLMASGGNEPVADGGGGGHSVFAAALLKGLRQIDKPRFTGAELFRYYVEESVAGQANQTPEYSPLRNSGHESGDFVFVKVKADSNSVGKTVKTPTTTGAAAALDPAALDLGFWESIKNSSDPEDYKAYLEKFPNGTYAALARRRATSTATTPAKSAGAETSGAVVDQAQELVTRAKEANEGQKFDDAVRLATEAINLNPRHGRAYGVRAYAYNSKGDYDAAITDATEAIRLAPSDYIAYNSRAFAYINKRNSDAAISDTTEAIRLNPQSASAYYLRASAYINLKGDSDTAMRDAIEAIRLDPQSAVVYILRARIYNYKGDYDAAIKDATEAIRLNPQYAGAYGYRAYAYNGKGDYDAAIRDATEAIRRSPQYADAYGYRALAYEKLGIKDRAKADRTKEAELKAKR